MPPGRAGPPRQRWSVCHLSRAPRQRPRGRRRRLHQLPHEGGRVRHRRAQGRGSPVRGVTSRTPSVGSARCRCAGTATRARRRSSPRTRVTPSARRATAPRWRTRRRRRRLAAPVTRPSKSPRPPAISAAWGATSRTPGSRRLHAARATSARPPARTRRSGVVARPAIARTAPAASPLHRVARRATRRPRCPPSTRPPDTPSAPNATRRPTRRHAPTARHARGVATPTSATTSRKRRAAPDVTYSDAESSSCARDANHLDTAGGARARVRGIRHVHGVVSRPHSDCAGLRHQRTARARQRHHRSRGLHQRQRRAPLSAGLRRHPGGGVASSSRATCGRAPIASCAHAPTPSWTPPARWRTRARSRRRP